MDDFVKTREMDLGPVRVPVMVRKNVADTLAVYLLEQGRGRYDTALEEVIRLGIDAARRQEPHPGYR